MDMLTRLLNRLRRPLYGIPGPRSKKVPLESDMQIQERAVRYLEGRAKGARKHFEAGLAGDPQVRSKRQRRAYQSHMDKIAHAARVARIQLLYMKARA